MGAAAGEEHLHLLSWLQEVPTRHSSDTADTDKEGAGWGSGVRKAGSKRSKLDCLSASIFIHFLKPRNLFNLILKYYRKNCYCKGEGVKAKGQEFSLLFIIFTSQ